MINNDLIIIRMLKNGARGYILKDCEPAELKTALLEVFNNGYYYNDIITSKMKERASEYNENSVVMINERELIFLRWACTDKSYKEIADEMGVSPRTIDGYRDALFQKLNVNSRVGLAVYAFRNDIITL